jgi:hypothetical protein
MQIEGVTYEIDWRKFKKGRSIFLPCFDSKSAKTQLLEVTDRLKLKVLVKVVIVEGIRGLRIWRM